jgi:hypothetical protein
VAIDREKLKGTVAQLQAELNDVEALDSVVIERLRGALADVQTALDRPATQAPAPQRAPGLVERLGDSALRLEESHPTLSTAIGNLAGILGQMGF